MLGSYFGVLADRHGRRVPIAVAVAMFGSCTFACGFAGSFHELLLLRLVAGIGIGGAVPNMIALTAEFAPKRIRSLAVTVVLWGFPIGAIVGGLLSSSVIEAHGWRAVFLSRRSRAASAAAGAAAPAAGIAALSRFDRARIGATGAHSDADPPDLLLSPTTRFRIDEPVATRGRIFTLFRTDLAPGALLLATAGFFSLLLSYLMGSWTPSLLHNAGLSVRSAILGAVILNFGGLVGSFVLVARR